MNSVSAGATYSATIPGTDVLSTATNNNSPVFKTSDTVVICANNYFKYDFGALDIDGDNLEYRFEEAYLGGSTSAPARGLLLRLLILRSAIILDFQREHLWALMFKSIRLPE